MKGVWGELSTESSPQAPFKDFLFDRCADINWYEPDGQPKDWGHNGPTLMCLLDGTAHAESPELPDDDLLLLFNAGHREVSFTLPAGGECRHPWHLFLDTGYPHPLDLYPNGNGPALPVGARYPLIQRSMACFHRQTC